jgi:hypothetical protein
LHVGLVCEIGKREDAMADAAARDLYEDDFYAWTQDQATRLRAFAGDNRFDAERVAEAWDEAVRAADDELSDYGEGPIGDIGDCPFTLDDMIHPQFDMDTAVATLQHRLACNTGSG